MKSARVRDYMTTSVLTLTPEMDILRAVNLLVTRKISGAPVLDQQGNLVGMLSELDCLKVALDAGYYEQHAGHVSEYMSRGVQTVDAGASVFDVAELFLSARYRRYPVMDDNRLVGQISRSDLLRAIDQLTGSD